MVFKNFFSSAALIAVSAAVVASQECVSFIENFDDPNIWARGWTTDSQPNIPTVEGGNMVLSLKQNATSPVGTSAAIALYPMNFTYGRVAARIKTANKSPGVVCSFILRDKLIGDEVDYEWTGKEPNTVQSDYFRLTLDSQDPNTISYQQGAGSNFSEPAYNDFHIYEMDWNPERIIYTIDGAAVRTVLHSEAKLDPRDNKTYYPTMSSPPAFGIWNGYTGAAGTNSWAGGPVDFTKGPFDMLIDWFQVDCYGKPPAVNGTAPPNRTVTTPPSTSTPKPVIAPASPSASPTSFRPSTATPSTSGSVNFASTVSGTALVGLAVAAAFIIGL